MAAKKSSAKKSAARRASPARKSSAKKSAARRTSPARKSTAKKSAARRTSPAKKSTAKKSAARRASPAKKSAARRTSPARKPATKKSTVRRPGGTRRSSRARVTPVEIVRHGYQAFAAGDVQWLDKHLSDDIVWHVPGQNPLSADYRGKQEVLAFFGLTMKVTGSTFRIELHDVVGNDDHVVAIGTQFAHGPEGEFFEGRFAQVFHIRNEQATEVWTHPEDSAAVDDFFTRIIREEIVLVPG